MNKLQNRMKRLQDGQDVENEKSCLSYNPENHVQTTAKNITNE